MKRSNRPVFVMGCHRSGTNLLYDTLQSAGGFAIYNGYLPVYKMLIPRFGHPSNLESRRRMVEAWLRSKGFRRSGLDAVELSQKLVRDCRTGGDFIRITMNEIAARQSAARWAIYDPDSVLYLPEIKADLPESLFIHIIRDGRDIALSLKKMGGFRPFPWDQPGSKGLEATALYWEWMVRKGREHGQRFPDDYLEVHYEQLISNPRPTLARLGTFLDHDVDYDRIQATAVGRWRESNSSFLEETGVQPQNAVNRWKERLSPEQIARLESLIGQCLEESGYSLTEAQPRRLPSWRESSKRAFYFRLFNAKLWLKTQTPAGRLTNLSALELIDELPAKAICEAN